MELRGAAGVWRLASGVWAIVTLALAIAPSLLFEFFRIVPDFVPREWTESLMYGIPVIAYTVLGAMGLTLLLMRRRPVRSTTTGVAIVGFVVAPVLLAASLLVMSALMLLSMANPAMMGFLPSDVWMTWLPHFLMGGSVSVAVAQLTFTVVIARR